MLPLEHEVGLKVGNCFFNFWWGFFELIVGIDIQLGVVVVAVRISRRV